MIERPKQTTSQELRDDLLQFIRLKFYEGDFVSFAKDTRLLLKWVILYPASWLNKRGVTLPAERYKKIVTDILFQAVRLGNTESIRYRPAWLAKVIQSHFAMHALLFAGKSAVRAPDPVSELAAASRLLKPAKRRPLRPSKGPVNLELKLP